MKIQFVTATILTAMGLAQSAAAQDAGEWIVRSGFIRSSRSLATTHSWRLRTR